MKSFLTLLSIASVAIAHPATISGWPDYDSGSSGSWPDYDPDHGWTNTGPDYDPNHGWTNTGTGTSGYARADFGSGMPPPSGFSGAARADFGSGSGFTGTGSGFTETGSWDSGMMRALASFADGSGPPPSG